MYCLLDTLRCLLLYLNLELFSNSIQDSRRDPSSCYSWLINVGLIIVEYNLF
jgi:hypothetical protein